jgi:PIN domain nuclease of toxin-antitoxin system
MRRLLLDTHTLLWWLADDPRLGQEARGLIADGANEVYVSAASAWEISIKKAIGKLKAPDDLDSVVQDEGFSQLEISFFHGERAGELSPLHRDPFDRMLIAQAQAEGLDIVTSDAMLGKYGLKTINASQ